MQSHEIKLADHAILTGYDQHSNEYMVKLNGSDGFRLFTFKEMKKEFGASSHDLKKMRMHEKKNS